MALIMKTNSKVAIVTGAGTGIGRAVAQALLADGWRVVLAGRRLELLQAVVAETANGQALALATDVSLEAAVTALFDAAVHEYGRIDLLFNNAGVY